METILSIVGVALSIAGLIPAYTAKNVTRKITLTALSLSIAGIFGCQVWLAAGQRRLVEKTKERVTLMMGGNQPMSFEQICERLNSTSSEIAATAINELEADGIIHQRMLDVKSPHGGEYRVRVFNSVNFGIE